MTSVSAKIGPESGAEVPAAPRAPSYTLRPDSFTESAAARLRRIVLGLAYACHPRRIAALPSLLFWTAADFLRGGTRVPDPSRVVENPDAFAGVCRDISPQTILAAARLGFYPWCHVGPLKWWTRNNRMVLFFDDHHIAKRFRSTMRNSPYRVTFDTAFDEVIRACAEPRSNRAHALTWITPKIMRLYAELHRMGYAHSVEVWDADGRLAGGCYGVAVGKVFITESQFHRQNNASKIGYHVLNHHLAKWGFVINDNKGWTEATAAMGFREIPRAQFEAILAEHARHGDRLAPWMVEDDPATVAASIALTPPARGCATHSSTGSSN